jgi:hypothetical protein
MSTISISATTQRPGRSSVRRWLSVAPWLTVAPLAVVLAYGDGFWLISLRGAAGAIERTQDPFATWVRESTLALPFFGIAVLGALMLAARWFGPVLHTKTVLATALLVVAAGTLVSVAGLAASSAYDYHLQASQVMLMDSMRMVGSTTSMGSMGSTALQQHSAFVLQARAVGYGSGILLITNLVLVGWVVAMRGGRLKVSKAR